jgi:hypothetical protein
MLQQLTTDHVAKLGGQRARIGGIFFALIEVSQMSK